MCSKKVLNFRNTRFQKASLKNSNQLEQTEKNKSSKEYVWGYPKQNPNKSKKHFHKKK